MGRLSGTMIASRRMIDLGKGWLGPQARTLDSFLRVLPHRPCSQHQVQQVVVKHSMARQVQYRALLVVDVTLQQNCQMLLVELVGQNHDGSVSGSDVLSAILAGTDVMSLAVAAL